MEVGGGSSTAPPAGGDGDCNSSCCSGTLSSSNTPIGSPSSSSSFAGFHPPAPMDLDAEARASKLGHLKDLLQEFSRNRNASLERWFLEMDAAWVLHLAGNNGNAAAAAARGIILVSPQLPHVARRWILALRSIKDSIFAYIDGLRRDHEDDDDTSTPSVEVEVEREPTDAQQPSLTEFSRFVESTIAKMLLFVDAIVALDSSSSSEHIVIAAETKLQALVLVRDALSTASEYIRLQFWPSLSNSSHVVLVLERMSDLLSSKLGKLDRAIWDTTHEIRTGIMDDGGGVSFISPDVHELTRSVTSCIKLLDTNYALFSHIAYEAAQAGTFVPETRNVPLLTSLAMGMLSCLEEKLAAMPRSFQQNSLGFLFLINNSYFIWQQLNQMFDMRFPMAALNHKIEDYIQSYLQASWSPVLSCLYHAPRPLRLGRYSPLPRFELEFQKVYTSQKMWKVPDPEMRARLRKAIANKITSGFTKFLQDNSDTTPRVTPGELEEMLQELFEG
ncbi:unnamed protein product [Urochloa humidicola]